MLRPRGPRPPYGTTSTTQHTQHRRKYFESRSSEQQKTLAELTPLCCSLAHPPAGVDPVLSVLRC
eukprot:2612535-Alexandrium_andersonii.AAC.1